MQAHFGLEGKLELECSLSVQGLHRWLTFLRIGQEVFCQKMFLLHPLLKLVLSRTVKRRLFQNTLEKQEPNTLL